jgi:hypothetical protein
MCLGAIQVQAVENYLSSSGFSNVTVADNQLFIEADGTAANVQEDVRVLVDCSDSRCSAL